MLKHSNEINKLVLLEASSASAGFSFTCNEFRCFRQIMNRRLCVKKVGVKWHRLNPKQQEVLLSDKFLQIQNKPRQEQQQN